MSIQEIITLIKELLKMAEQHESETDTQLKKNYYNGLMVAYQNTLNILENNGIGRKY